MAVESDSNFRRCRQDAPPLDRKEYPDDFNPAQFQGADLELIGELRIRIRASLSAMLQADRGQCRQ
jgi:hypothetical protein